MPHSLLHYNDAIHWINTIISTNPNTRTQHIPKSKKHDRIKHLLALFDNPQNEFQSIHITGSKGKSSTSNAVSYILQKYNISSGLFTSPHIHEYTERIKINHSNIDKETFVSVINEIYQSISKHTIHPSMFEVLFTAACIIFKRKQVQYAIFEVGIGGRYDTTNIIFPVASIITNIEKEHTDILGNTIEEIAYDKAGIIKPRIPVFVERQTNPTILPIIEDYATKQSAPYYYIPDHIDISPYETTSTTINNHIRACPLGVKSWMRKHFFRLKKCMQLLHMADKPAVGLSAPISQSRNILDWLRHLFRFGSMRIFAPIPHAGNTESPCDCLPSEQPLLPVANTTPKVSMQKTSGVCNKRSGARLPHARNCRSAPNHSHHQTRICTIISNALPENNHSPFEIKSLTLSPIIIENQILASIAVHYLLKKPIPEKQFFTHTAQLMCRSELLTLDNTQKIFLDGAHTAQSIHYALQCIETLQTPTILLLALAKGKNYTDISKKILEKYAMIDEIIITTPGCLKESEPHILFQHFKEYQNPIRIIEDNKEAIAYAYTKARQSTHTQLISVLGSFFVAASCRYWYLEQQSTNHKDTL